MRGLDWPLRVFPGGTHLTRKPNHMAVRLAPGRDFVRVQAFSIARDAVVHTDRNQPVFNGARGWSEFHRVPPGRPPVLEYKVSVVSACRVYSLYALMLRTVGTDAGCGPLVAYLCFSDYFLSFTLSLKIQITLHKSEPTSKVNE